MVTVTTEGLERAERWVDKVVSLLNKTATTLDTVNAKVVELIDGFAEGMEDEIAKIREAHDDAVDACMANHPAGSGVFDEVVDEDEEATDLSREEKIEAIRNHLRSGGLTTGDWFTHPENISDNTVNWGYDYINNRAKAWDTYN